MFKFLKNWNKQTPKAVKTAGDVSLVVGTAAGIAAIFIPGVPILLTVAAVAGGAGKIISKLFAVEPSEEAVELSESLKDVADVINDIKTK